MSEKRWSDYNLTGRWLELNGVPHFSRKDRTWSGIPIFLLNIFLISAFQLSVLTPPSDPASTGATGLLESISAGGIAALIIVPPAFLTLSWLVRRPLMLILGITAPNGQGQSERESRAECVQARCGFAALLLVVVLMPIFAWQWFPTAPSGMGILVPFLSVPIACLAALIMWNSTLWAGATRSKLWWLLVVLVAVTMVIALSSRWWPPVGEWVGMALLIATMLTSITFSARLVRPETSSERLSDIPPASLMVLVAGFGLACYSFTDGSSLGGFLVVVVLLVIGLLVLMAVGRKLSAWVKRRSRKDSKATPPARRPDRAGNLTAQGMTPLSLIFWAMLCLTPYPAWLLVNQRWAAFWIGIAFNAGWLVLSFSWVYFRVSRIIRWAAREIRGNFGKIALSLSRALPVVSLVSVVALFTAGIWQAAATIEPLSVLVAGILLVGLNLAILGLAERRQVDERRIFKTKKEIASSVAWNEVLKEPQHDEESEEMAAQATKRGQDAREQFMKCVVLKDDLALGAPEKWNAVVAAVVFRLVVLVPAGAAAVVVLALLGWLVVPTELFTEWTKNLKSCQPAGACSEPFARAFVAVTIAEVGLLNLIVGILREGSGKAPVDAGGLAERADHALREQLAVRLIHLALDPHRINEAPSGRRIHSRWSLPWRA